MFQIPGVVFWGRGGEEKIEYVIYDDWHFQGSLFFLLLLFVLSFALMDDNTRTSAAEEEGEDRVSSNAPSVVFTEPNTYKRAWFALLLVVLLRIAVSVFQFSYSVVPGITAEYLNVSLTAVNWFATVTGLTYVIVSIYTGWIFENLGVRRSVCKPICCMGKRRVNVIIIL